MRLVGDSLRQGKAVVGGVVRGRKEERGGELAPFDIHNPFFIRSPSLTDSVWPPSDGFGNTREPKRAPTPKDPGQETAGLSSCGNECRCEVEGAIDAKSNWLRNSGFQVSLY